MLHRIGHTYIFQNREYPILYTLISTNAGKAQNERLNEYTVQVESTHRGERVRRVIAKNELPWKTWINNNNKGRYVRTEVAIEDGM